MSSIEQEKLLRGKPIPCAGVCEVYHATIGEVVDLGRDTFYEYIFLLTADPQKSKLFDQPISTFSFLQIQSVLDPRVREKIENAFQFFLREKVHFLTDLSEIQIGEDVENHRCFTEENYPEFITTLRTIYRLQAHDQVNPQDQRTRAIAEKIRRGQAQVQAIKAKQGSNDDIDVATLVSSLGLYYKNVNMVWELPYYTFFDQITRLQYKQKYENNVMYTAAGAKIPEKDMKYWIRKVQDVKGG